MPTKLTRQPVTPLTEYATIIRRLSGKTVTPAVLKKIYRLRADGLRYVAKELLPSPYINRSNNTLHFAGKK